MAQREFGAVAMSPVFLLMAQVTGIVKQRSDDPQRYPLRAKTIAGLDAAFVARGEPRHGQSHVQRVLNVVISGVDTVVVGVSAGEHAFEVMKREPQHVDAIVWVQRPE